MLLIIEALLLISAALGKDHRAAVKGKIFPLDMALDSVDDLYNGCKEKMAEQVDKEYLKKELRNSVDFEKVWEIGKNKVSKNYFLDKLKTKHKIAIYAYTYIQIDPNLNIYEKFNKDIRYGKQNYPVMKYKWYSLHFLLTEAVQILKKTQNRCFDTFRGTKVTFENDVLNKEVRFGSFTSSSLERSIAKRFGTVSCFVIHTCEGANITKYSMLRHEEEVLIPPYEKFIVTAIRTGTNQKHRGCKTEFVLESTGIRSDLNCALYNQPKP
ncbi:NAD(P)(+)--arginine ADP-ribosyltransferase 2-like isoform X2 [Carassius gibelio]|uniref:NAD(P)(+)--arginine ADP-ribosyltransferase 2-like isoform X1 n=1 Tax=Carassius gibelio TaxID=101364 RepID=UPI002277F741|nr:NAD(P)(+)--arginine ADP-ribosyltransferase 2-like isoform X1 [Carassius gibelio]XP_052408195.1 NAD(P)(+)--arginine ADP-ribosyltransferase 2-like isoform X2 [Carassius gibelio]